MTEPESYLDLLAILRHARIDQQMTQFDLDEKAGFSTGVIAKYESGQRAPLSYNLYVWALALGLSLTFKETQARQGSGHQRPTYKGVDLDERIQAPAQGNPRRKQTQEHACQSRGPVPAPA